MAILAPATAVPISPWDHEWIEAQREVALKALAAVGRRAYMEARFVLHAPKTHVSQRILDDAARDAPIHTFGWPIGIYFDNRPEFRPRPTADGIVAEAAIADRSSYDYWSIRRNGDYYYLGSLFEDDRDPNKIFFNTRIVRTTEALLYCARLYARLSVDASAPVQIGLRHGGLRGRTIGASNPARHVFERRPATEDVVDTEIATTLGDIESTLVQHARDLVAPLFMVFDFFEVSEGVLEEIVDAFVQGKVT